MHPIAGRCKHCKADLVRVRGGTTGAGETPVQIPQLGAGGAAAAVPLPMPGTRSAAMPPLAAMAGAAPAPMAAPPSASAYVPAGFTPASAAPPPPASAVPALHAQAPGQPLQASGAHGHGHAHGGHTHTLGGATHTHRHASWGHRWPLAVAAIAALAILASLAVMMLGDQKKHRTTHRLGPAPERMDTDIETPLPVVPRPNPTPNPPAVDPADPGAGSAVPHADLTDPFDPHAANPGAAPDPSDPWQSPPVLPSAPHTPGAVPRVSTPAEFMSAIVDVGCDRLQSCLRSSDTAQSVCRQARQMVDLARLQPNLSCVHFDASAAQSCLAAISRLPCPANDAFDLGELAKLALSVDSCARSCSQ
ncbi:MAG TPA: hypothetical protein VHE35_16135 [Kofleriaceae bacterium]|nr:hypothetical protein [Kofleriaceae bacterium]